MPHRRFVPGLALVLAACASAPLTAVQSASARPQPPLTAQTRRSGGAMPAEQQRLHFDHAELHFDVHPATRSLDGEATLRFTARAPTDVLLLDLDRNLTISTIAVDGRPLPPTAWSNPDGRLRITLPTPLAQGGSVRTTIRYGGQPHVAKRAPWDGGFVWSHTADGQPWIASAVEGEGCDLFWPCIDQPEGEPDLVDTYVTAPKALAAPGNGVLVGITGQGDTRTWHWRIKQPNTYAIAINVGPFKELRGNYASRYGNTIPLEFWYLRGHAEQAKALFAEFPRMLDFFEQEIGPYPFGNEKMGVVETPYLGMEHQTLNAYGHGYPKSEYGFDWLLQHEFAHEWFGNQMTNADWDDMWLHEGFGTYMQPLFGQYLYGDMPYFSMLHTERLALANRRPIVSGHSRTEDAVYDDATGPGLDIYYKSSLMLHTLRGLIGDRAFFASIRQLVYGRTDPKPGNFQPRYASTADYIGIVDRVSGRDLHWFFDVYLYDAALPRLQTTRHGDTLLLQWITGHGEPFPMPLEVQVGNTLRTLPMTHGQGRVHAPPGTLVIVDPRSKLLREMPHVEAFQAWKRAQAAKAKPSAQK